MRGVTTVRFVSPLLLAVWVTTFGAGPASAATWVGKGPDGGLVLSNAVDPTNPLVVYAGTNNGGVYKSTDGGASWRPKRNGFVGSVEALAVDPTNPSVVWAGTRGAGVYKTTDGGGVWSKVNTGLFPPSNLSIYGLVIQTTASSTAWAATEDGLYKTTNGGASWVKRLSVAGMRSVAIDPTNPNVVYAGAVGTFSSVGGLWKTTNGGTSWTSIVTGLVNRYTTALAVDPLSPSTVYAGTSSGLYRSTNGGASWSPASAGMAAGVATVVIDPAHPATMYAATYDSGVFKTTDGAASWAAMNAGLGNLRVECLTLDAAGRLWASTNDGLWKSPDGAATWTSASRGISPFYTYGLLVDPVNPSTIWAGAQNVVFRTVDGGATWASAPTFPGANATSLALDPLTRTLYALTDRGMAVSTDDGASWAAAVTGLGTVDYTAVVFDPHVPSTVYLGTSNGMFRSDDSGATWHPSSAGLTHPRVNAVALDANAPGTLYAGTTPWETFRSVDGGALWTSVGLAGAGIETLAVDPTTPGVVYAGLYGTQSPNPMGVRKTTNGGATWTVMNAGFPPDVYTRVQSFAIDPIVPSTIHIATTQGVFVTTDGAGVWTPFNVGIEWTSPWDIAVDPGTPGRVWLTTSGNGVFALEAVCGDGVLDAGETCDDGNVQDGDCCSSACTLDSSATVCRPAAGACDVADRCTGAAPGCPADAKATGVCRAGAGSCDVAEECDGTTDDCPEDAFAAAGSECRAAAGACDVAEQCTGGDAACPADGKATGLCRASAGACDVAEECDGTGDDCPTDGFASGGTECRAAAGECDVAEQCDGSAAACPADAKSTAVCRPAAGPCDVADVCDGVQNACPGDVFASAGTVCRPAAGPCDVAEACTAAAAACPANGGLPDGDGDGLCDAVDPCTNVGGGRTLSGVNPIPKIVFERINTNTVPGNDRFVLTGAFVLPAGARFADLAPQTHGAHVVLRNRFGLAELDVALPGGAYGGSRTRGWKLANQGKEWTYSDSTTAPIGAVTTIVLTDRNTQLPGRVEIRVVGDDGTYPVVAGDEPIDGILTVGGPAQAAAGLCGETAFVPADCFYNSAGSQLTCRQQ